MSIQLSILIPTTSDRCDFYADVMTELCRQVRVLSEYNDKDYWRYVEILKDPRGKEYTTGTKRNDLYASATGKFSASIDSDDMVPSYYLRTLLENIEANPNAKCFSLLGIMTTDGNNPEMFEHSMRYNRWHTHENAAVGSVKHERYPNHLNAIRSDIAKQIKFPDLTVREDHLWSEALYKSGLIRPEDEVYIDKVLYNYKVRSNK